MWKHAIAPNGCIGCVGRWSGTDGILRCEGVVTGLAAITREPLAGQVVNTALFG